uniref:ABC transporter substrate-binding protein n=1 Tax=Desulfacinum infernum TaxID=35837 RepID=A0A832A7S1_9BACT
MSEANPNTVSDQNEWQAKTLSFLRNEKAKAFLLAAFVLPLVVAGCGREPIKIGFSGTLTGPFSDLGIHGRNGARMAVEAMNEAGGILGRPLELLVADDLGTPEGAVQADRDLAAQGVVAIIGHMTSSQSMAALPVTEETGVPLISPTTSTPLLKGRTDLFFRVQPTTDAAARALARWVTGKPSVKTVCTLRDTRNDAYSGPWEAAFVEEYVRLNGLHLISCRLTYGNTEPPVVETVVRSLHVARPDAVLLVSSARDAAFFLHVFASEGIQTQILSSAWAQTEAFLAESGPLAENLLFASENMPTDGSARLRDFSWEYRKRFGIAPSFAAVRAYEAVQLTASALKETAGRRDGLVKALATPRTIDGLYGPLAIDPYGDATGPYFMVRVKEARFVVVEFLPGAPP